MKMLPILALGGAALLSACASGPAVPDWQMNAKSSMERATAAYMAGNERVEAQEFSKARSEMASTGRAELVARVELIRCASHVASLVQDDCPGFEALRQDAPAPEQAYARYLAGKAQRQDVALIPAQHHAVLNAASDPAAAAAVAGIGDPLSRLVAAGVLLRSGRATPALLAQAVDTASAQGWRRPLLAWLGVQAMRAEKAGDTVEAQRLRRRMALAAQPSQ
jgi:hypothetical protein